MEQKKRFLIIILLTFTYSMKINSQLLEDSIVLWNKSRTLNCSDFKGKKPLNIGNIQAGTSAEINAKGFREGALPNFKVCCSFDKKISWIVDSLCVQILKHEQLHFDIAELYARKIRKGVLDLRKRHQTNLEPYDKLINNLLEERNKVDDQYDQETAHGVYCNRQKEWNKRIEKELEELKDYEIDYTGDLDE